MNDIDTSIPQSAAPRVEAAAFVGRPRRRWRRIAVGAGLLLALLFALTLVLLRSREPEAALPERDVPRAEGGAIVLSNRYRERMGIRTITAREAPITPLVRVVGNVAFDPKYQASVGTRLKGFVRKVVRYEGDSVKQGELLAEIDSPDLAQAQASVTTLRAQRDAAERNAKREGDLATRGLTTAREVEVADATLSESRAKLAAAEQRVSALGGGPGAKSRRVFGLHEITSPLDGTVVERHVAAGQSVEANLVAFRVANLDHLWVELAVFERNVSSIKKGDHVDLRPLDTGEANIGGQVAHVGEQVDIETRTVAVRVEVDNHERRLRPGQAVTAEIRASGARRSSAVVVPRSALTYVDGKPTVFVAESPTRLVPTPVELGDTDGKDQAVLSGLRSGAEVVSEGVFALKSELYR